MDFQRRKRRKKIRNGERGEEGYLGTRDSIRKRREGLTEREEEGES